ncbi:carboxypeptidase-like regulatory domain-containing protein [uncultured Croceitalea sp.]|uniref:carboxypeptidase-like regulatory domain-containing protein n=1 Tax=uncultured Croceitalea sp. TaxID=1798908 RepID=UPI00374F8898
MKCRFQIPLFLFLLGTSIKGQSIKNIKGQVVVNNKDVTGVVVQNITSEKATITDVDGNFVIQVVLNDTLVFSAVQFKRKVLPITTEIYSSTFLKIPLEEFVNELREVVVQPFNLSGNLDADLVNLKLEKDVSAEALGLPNAHVRVITQSENKLNDADHGKFAYYYVIALTINLNKVLNRLSGRTKMLKERVALDKKYKATQKVEATFVDSLLINHLKIPKENFYEFIRFCESEKEFYSLAQDDDELKLWEFLIQKSSNYRKIKKLD